MKIRKLYAKLAELCDAGHNYFTDKAARGLLNEWKSSRVPGAYVSDAKLPVDSGDMGQLRLALKDEDAKDALIVGYTRGKNAANKKMVPAKPEDEQWNGPNWNQGNNSNEGDD